MILRSYATIHNQVTALLDKLPLADGKKLKASNTQYNQEAPIKEPLLLIRDGQDNLKDDNTGFTVVHEVTLNAFLYIGENGNGLGFQKLRAYQQDILVQCQKLGHLPYSTTTGDFISDLSQYRLNDVEYLINRKPLRLSKFMPAAKPVDELAVAVIQFSLAFDDNCDPYTYSPMRAYEVLFADKEGVDITETPIDSNALSGAHIMLNPDAT